MPNVDSHEHLINLHNSINAILPAMAEMYIVNRFC